ncbi:MAG: type I methionyl aminopeptidase [Omnitrophica WOR_2 bacterium RIFCSPHIGHO2_02_FULL_52_10]|nr:MAG: type I methionyl aminopeptidase [Omnitrophica WOR_2 bacterium RIFCSPHIGHO2_02_FULL_52_10]
MSIKTPGEIKILREAGQILSAIISEVRCSLKSGMTTREIDRKTGEIILARRVKPAFKGYRSFPGCVCVSVNEEVVHGIPGERILQEGDVVSLDIGIIHKQYYSDTAVTVAVGRIQPALQKLLDVTLESLYQGIEQARAGNHLSDISHAIQERVESNGFSVVKEFVGHGIGKHLHEDPEIPNFGPPHQGPLLKEGMVFAIEPMVNFGAAPTKLLDDGWTVVTQDGKPSAHFEHSVLIGQNGPEILTQ